MQLISIQKVLGVLWLHDTILYVYMLAAYNIFLVLSALIHIFTLAHVGRGTVLCLPVCAPVNSKFCIQTHLSQNNNNKSQTW